MQPLQAGNDRIQSLAFPHERTLQLLRELLREREKEKGGPQVAPNPNPQLRHARGHKVTIETQINLNR